MFSLYQHNFIGIITDTLSIHHKCKTVNYAPYLKDIKDEVLNDGVKCEILFPQREKCPHIMRPKCLHLESQHFVHLSWQFMNVVDFDIL